jgi:hypothetical protein
LLAFGLVWVWDCLGVLCLESLMLVCNAFQCWVQNGWDIDLIFFVNKKCVDILNPFVLAPHGVLIANPSLSRRMQRRFACVRSDCVWYCIIRDIWEVFYRFLKKTHKFEMKLNNEKKVEILESQRW